MSCKKLPGRIGRVHHSIRFGLPYQVHPENYLPNCVIAEIPPPTTSPTTATSTRTSTATEWENITVTTRRQNHAKNRKKGGMSNRNCALMNRNLLTTVFAKWKVGGIGRTSAIRERVTLQTEGRQPHWRLEKIQVEQETHTLIDLRPAMFHFVFKGPIEWSVTFSI